MKYIVVGLGNFGSYLAKRLTNMGNDVIGVDSREAKVEMIKDSITHAITMDASDPHAVKSLPCREVDVVIVAIGEDFGASMMVTALFKQMNVKRLISRSINKVHETIIKAIGVDEIIHPEEDSAERLAKRLQLKGVTDSLDVSEDYNIVEVQAPERYVGMSIADSQIRQKYNINVLSIIKMEEKKNLFGQKISSKRVMGVVKGETVIEAGDFLLLFGHVRDIKKILSVEE
jgi:trk system potassium uptake protein TrkA